ncbi:hypothetical protein L249_8987 [Ophiocordyceps polyrhachis-furcata BCC 54312]|uniref:Uncharacterized protein n=1 Tax=Ophiocordyceps polyrhachis-furcata BCC 54312 TaxID=1330021 RepID=A0A367L268_9HYPO|nr:hypothetical protein L249_8987 [Ophiocordyceps polyrhachis-furcata BCC 54312]
MLSFTTDCHIGKAFRRRHLSVSGRHANQSIRRSETANFGAPLPARAAGRQQPVLTDGHDRAVILRPHIHCEVTAGTLGRPTGEMPHCLCSDGSTKRCKVTSADAGFPGREKMTLDTRWPASSLKGMVANVVGLPGFIATRPKWMVPPRRRSMVHLAHGDAAGGDEHVGLSEASSERLLQRAGLVPCDAEVDDVEAPFLGGRDDRYAVRVADLAQSQRSGLDVLDNLVSGGQDADDGPSVDLDLGHADGREESDFAPDAGYLLALLRGARRQGGASSDSRDLAFPERLHLAGSRVRDGGDWEDSRHVSILGGDDGVTVDDTCPESGDVLPGLDGLGHN